MKRVKQSIVVLVAMVLVFLPWQDKKMAKEWDFQSIDQVDKAWSVKFNMKLDANSVNQTSIVITDGKTVHPSVARLVGNGYEVQVVPSAPYEVGKAYWLKITSSVKSSDGKALKTPIEVPFQLIDPNADIQAVHSMTSGIFTVVTVTANPRVHRVTLNGTDMHFIGNNQYTYTLLDTKPGSSVTIYGYDENNKRVETKRHTVQ